MFITNVRIFLATLALAWAPGLAWSLTVPEGKAAVIEALLGKVELKVAGKSTKPKVGQALDHGDTLVTGANGRASLRHSGNAVTRLAPNTELTLKAAEAGQKGTFLSLGKGLIRFLVGKRAPGETFEVRTSNAVAAVKGTDAEVGSDGKKTTSSVFASGRQKALELLSSATGKAIFLAPGQSAGLDDNGFQSRDLSKDDFEAAKEAYNGLPEPDVEGDDAPEAEAPEQGSTNELAEAVSDAFSDLMADLNIDNLLERDERTGDTVAGRIAYDRNGDRTQISSWVTRADDTTIVKATYSQRKTGPFVGTTFAEEQTTWNRPLPADWASIARHYLDSPQNIDSNGEPIHWRASQYFRAGNPQGDVMEVARQYQRPYFQAYNYGEGLYYRDYLMPQGFSQQLNINGQPIQYISWLADATYYDGLREVDPSVPTLIADYPQPYESTWESYMNYDETTVTYGYAVFSEDPPFLEAEVRVLDSDGSLLSPEQTLYDYPTHLRYFRGLSNSYSIELTYKSSYFSAPIDLLIIPEIFNHFDFFDMPGDEYYGPPTFEQCMECEA